MSRRPMLAGNWKMFTTPAEAAALGRAMRTALMDPPAVDIALFPPFTSIAALVAELKATDIIVGGQDVHPEPEGAFTGNVSAPMLVGAGCGAALIGHSERRTYEKEAGEYLARKVRAALAAGPMPVFCCGETLAEREANKALEIVRGQLSDALAGLTGSEAARVVIAYEPVWAIGTGRVATPEQAQEVHAAIRAWIGLTWGAGLARSMRILYGGSVKPANVRGIMAQPDIDGALVGGASLNADSFAGIVRFQDTE